MTPDELFQRPAGDDDAVSDIYLSGEETADLIDAMAELFAGQRGATDVLNRVDYPRNRVPHFNDDGDLAHAHWSEIFTAVDNGVIPLGRRRILAAALRVYPWHTVLRPLADRHGVRTRPATVPSEHDDDAPGDAEPMQRPEAQAAGPAPADGDEAGDPVVQQQPGATCHVIIRASDEEARQAAMRALAGHGLDPREAWSTSHAVSFSVNSDDISEVRAFLDTTDLGWTVVPPGDPDYLLRHVYVEGPDRRRFRVVDVPAQQTARNLAEEIITEQYPQGDERAPLPTVIDHISDGETQRVNPDDTLHDAGVRDGDQLRVAYQTNAGVHPDDHFDALVAARDQIRSFAESRDDFVIDAAPLDLPTEYRLMFHQRSFGPGQSGAADPTEVDEHVVHIQLSAEFPAEAPIVWWVTPIFHPNVIPNYDRPGRPRNSGNRGLVCLGEIGESWQPAFDFQDLCRMLVDIAAFRNYALFAPTGAKTPSGQPELKGNFVDEAAAAWVVLNAERIAAIGGEMQLARPPEPGRPEYHNVIEILE